MAETAIQIDDRWLNLSNLDKVMYPSASGAGFTKGDVIEYYRGVAPALLPHFRDRPVTLVRYPDGVQGKHFFEKNCPAHRPPWLETQRVPRSSKPGEIVFCLLQDEASLAWVANLAALELHPFLHRSDLSRPTMLVLDLDPGPERVMRDCAKLALVLRDLLAELRLDAFVKTSGGKGLHLAVPLNSKVTYGDTKPFARALAGQLEGQMPEQVTANMKKARRKGRILIDWSQNTVSKTTAGPYSLRGKSEPSVSMPMTWEEVEVASRRRKRLPLDMSPRAVLKRVEKHGDLWAKVQTLRQMLPTPP